MLLFCKSDIGKIIEEAGCGYWVESGDLNGIQIKITQLCKDDLIVMGEKGWDLLQREYLVERSYGLIVDSILK